MKSYNTEHCINGADYIHQFNGTMCNPHAHIMLACLHYSWTRC